MIPGCLSCGYISERIVFIGCDFLTCTGIDVLDDVAVGVVDGLVGLVGAMIFGG